MAYYLSPALERLRGQINAAYPRRDKTTDGWIGDAAHSARKSDHNPDYDAGGIVRAIDVDEDLHGPSTVDKGAVAQALVNRIITDPRVAYVIYEGRIWTPSRGWQPYTSAGKAGWFNPHKMHFHVSVRHGRTWDHDDAPWPITGGDIDTEHQIALTLTGHYTGAIDGEQGSRTTAAITAYQEDHDLHPDGVLGPITTKHLENTVSDIIERIADASAKTTWNYAMDGGKEMPNERTVPTETAGERLRQVRRSTDGLQTRTIKALLEARERGVTEEQIEAAVSKALADLTA